MMTKVLKKSLACCLALVLCLTCMIGALTVNAEVIEGSFEIEDASVTVGTETVDVEVTVTAPGANELLMKVTTDAGEVTAVTSEDVGVEFDAAVSDTIGLTKGDESLEGFETAVIVVTVALTDAATVKDYDVTATLLSAASGVEDEYTIPEAQGTISVVEAAAEGLVATTEAGGSTSGYALRGRVRALAYAENAQNPVVAVGLLAMEAEGAPAEMTVETEGVFDYRLTTAELAAEEYTWSNAVYYINVAVNFAKTITKFAFVPYIELQDGTLVYAEKVEYSFADYLVANYGTNTKAAAILDAYYTMSDDAAFAGIANKYEALDSSKTYTKTYAENAYDLDVDSALTATPYAGGSTSNFKLTLRANNFAYTGEGTVKAVGLLVLDSAAYVSGPVTLETAGVYSYEYALNGTYPTLEAFNATNINVGISGLKLYDITKDYISVPYVRLDDDSVVYADGAAFCFADYLIDSGIKSANATSAARANGFLDAYGKVKGALYSVE